MQCNISSTGHPVRQEAPPKPKPKQSAPQSRKPSPTPAKASAPPLGLRALPRRRRQPRHPEARMKPQHRTARRPCHPQQIPQRRAWNRPRRASFFSGSKRRAAACTRSTTPWAARPSEHRTWKRLRRAIYKHCKALTMLETSTSAQGAGTPCKSSTQLCSTAATG